MLIQVTMFVHFMFLLIFTAVNEAVSSSYDRHITNEYRAVGTGTYPGSRDDLDPTAGKGSPQVKLVNGTDRCSGRVEVYHEGKWGTICDDDWDLNDAQVVCRQVGCGTALTVKTKAFFGEGLGRIWLYGMQCLGHERFLDACSHSGYRGPGHCYHAEDAGVICSNKVRLVNGTDRCSGRAEVFHNDEWVKLCSNDWSSSKAVLTCRELECGDPVSPQVKPYFGESKGLRGFTSRCSGNETSIADCSLQTHPAACDNVALKCTDIKCSYLDILTHLNMNMKEENRTYMATRPVLHHTKPTVVWLDVELNAILDVDEKDQKFISFLRIKMEWKNEFISWDPRKFCGIQRVSVPSGWLWKPDIIIDERLEGGAAVSPYVHIKHDGTVFLNNDEVVVSRCRMNVYKFPFDTQSCTLTFASLIYSGDELELKATYDKGETKYLWMWRWGEPEWEFDDVTYIKHNGNTYQDKIFYIITMKRKAILYIDNFLLPVLFFLCLDMASFLISDSGTKLGFKVTVLLAVTVLQLLLNDILPATSNRLPIIATYCIGSFALMLLSLLEAILVTYLLEKDSVPQKTETDKDHNLKEDETKGYSCDREKRCKWCPPCFCKVPDDDGDDDGDDDDDDRDTTHQPLSAAEEDNSLKGESHGLQVILDELRDLEKNLVLFFKSKEDGGSPGYWTRVATRIDKAFFIFYVTTVGVFLGIIFNAWSTEDTSGVK